ncbi:hypothetical protein ACJX0J_014416, partial [Zea mays]
AGNRAPSLIFQTCNRVQCFCLYELHMHHKCFPVHEFSAFFPRLQIEINNNFMILIITIYFDGDTANKKAVTHARLLIKLDLDYLCVLIENSFLVVHVLIGMIHIYKIELQSIVDCTLYCAQTKIKIEQLS